MKRRCHVHDIPIHDGTICARKVDPVSETNAAVTTDCDAMIVIRPERQGGVIFRCTRDAGHASEHTTGGMAEEYPLVENTADLPFLVRWATSTGSATEAAP